MALFKLLIWLFVLGNAAVASQDRSDGNHVIKLTSAQLEYASRSEPVALPHILRAHQFNDSSGRVVYTLRFLAAPDSAEALAIFIPKMSLSGRVFLNGFDLGGCGVGELESVRCLHRPLLLYPPSAAWLPDENILTVEIFANSRQMNGLSEIYVGPSETLHWSHYLPRRMIQIDLISALTWVSLTLATLALAMFYILPAQRLYLWFSIACFANALSNLNVLSSMSLGGTEFFSWLVFSARYVAMTFIWLTLASAMRVGYSWLSSLLVGMAVGASVVIWLGGNSRLVTVLAYLPLGVVAIFLTVGIIRQAILRNEFTVRATAVVCVLIMGSSVLDWFRLGGMANFNGFYLSAYAMASAMLLIGSLQVSSLAVALKRSKKLAEQLDIEVHERTLELQQLNQQLTILSRTDSLTGLANRRCFDETLFREFARAQRSQTGLSVLVIDVDFFKGYNDNYGHPAGDICLRKVGATLRQQSRRETDCLARIGGEEFALIDSTGGGQGVIVLAETLRAAIEEAELPHAYSPSGCVTVSIGIASYVPELDKSAGDLLSRADRALYTAKAKGRNRVEIAFDQQVV